jgi:hypothetical protein
LDLYLFWAVFNNLQRCDIRLASQGPFKPLNWWGASIKPTVGDAIYRLLW